MANKTKKIAAYNYGIFAEIVSIIYLSLLGYFIIARRYKTRLGEIDLIARRGKTIAIIEVKARKDNSIEEVLTSHQQKRIADAASLFIAKNPNFANFQVRFDLIIIKPWFRLKHVKNAWDAS